MATDGELGYFDAIGEDGRAHALGKPFTDTDRAGLLLQFGAVLSLLPPPPAKVLDCGCGTGWLSWMLQRCGYEVTGVDVAPAAVALAEGNRPYIGGSSPRFVAGEMEQLAFAGEFDAVVFFDSLHHAIDEVAALRGALKALKPGGVCVTSEPGKGHAHASAGAVDAFGVTERDMPAHHIVQVARSVGFEAARVHARADELGVRLYGAAHDTAGWKRAVRRSVLGRALLTLRTTEVARRDNGIVVLTAPSAAH